MSATPALRAAAAAAAFVLLCAHGAGAYDSAADRRVAVVPSDDPALPAPVARDADLTADQVLAMVRRAVDLVGGMALYVPDTAKVVLLKANISIPEVSGSGVVTDARVVRAVALLVHAAAPRARILIAEGAGGWMSPALRDCTDVEGPGGRVEDGFEIAGHRATVRQLRAQGVDIDCFDLNFDRAYSLHPAGGGLAHDEYAIAAAVLDADVFINVPLAKTHGAKITCCLKNHFGILPGRLYGWNKSTGTRHHGPMPHSPRVLDEAWIDLYGLTRVDLNVVDMIAGSEAGAFEEHKTQRANIVLAGANPIATDLVAARLMGFNPDDFEFAELAWQQGLGPRHIEEVDLRGADPVPLVRRWKKAGADYGWGEWAEHAGYGMGPRDWTLYGPVARDHAFASAQLLALAPVPGRDGWSQVVSFGHDRIDLDKHLDDPVDCAVYAFTRFAMATSDSVRFWVGSDEELAVWLDGDLIYDHRGRRRHVLGMDRIHGYVAAGEHRLLVRAGQGRGDFDFSVNVTEPIDDPFYAGNRYPGVRYYVDRAHTQMAQRVAADDVGDSFLGSAEEATVVRLTGAADPLTRSRTAPDTILLDVATPQRTDLLGLLAELSGTPAGALDATALELLGAAPFTASGGLGRGRGASADGPELARLLDWLGLRYAIGYGYGRRESLKNIHGWLAMGRVPITGGLGEGRGRRFGGGAPSSWSAITGYRQRGDAVELRLAGPGGERWVAVAQDWTATMPGGARRSCPVVVVEAGAAPPASAVLADSIAALALELSWPRWNQQAERWGTRRVPAGLAQWDAWVIEWERLPLTPDWARLEPSLDRLERVGRYPFPAVAAGRALAARYFAETAGRQGDAGRRAHLQAAAQAYGRVTREVEALVAAMPRTDSPAALTAGDEQRLAHIAEARPRMRAARDAEHEAVAALARLLGREAPPPSAVDPLVRKARGVQLFTWSAVTEDSVHDLVLVDDRLQVERLAGDDAEGAAAQVHAAMPHRAGWVVAVEVVAGGGSYTVEEQPAADNGWRLRVRADDTRVWEDNAPELVVWAVAPE